MKRILSLDGLRGVFCLLIVFEHYSPIYLPKLIYDFPVIRSSYIVVDFFFVLSGYILALKYWNSISDLKTLKSFYLKRLFRLYPLVLITSSFLLLIEIFTYYKLKGFKNDPISLYEISLRYLNDVLLVNSSNILGAHSMNIPSWSISAEFFCYLIFGIFLVYFKNLKQFLNVLLLSFIVLALTQEYAFPTFSFGFIRGIISFLVGVILFKSNILKNFKIKNNHQVIIIIIFGLSLYLLTLKTYLITKTLSIFLPFFFAFTIHIILNGKGILTRFLTNPFITKIGDLSFSIYLNHFVVVLIIPRLIFQILKVPNTTIYQIMVFILCPIIVILISKFTNKYIEVKFNKYLRDRFI